MIVVSDASPLNVLIRIGHVEILSNLFGSVVIPPAVVAELTHARTPDPVRAWLAAARGLLNLSHAFDRLKTTDFNIADDILRDALERDAKRGAFRSESPPRT